MAGCKPPFKDYRQAYMYVGKAATPGGNGRSPPGPVLSTRPTPVRLVLGQAISGQYSTVCACVCRRNQCSISVVIRSLLCPASDYRYTYTCGVMLLRACSPLVICQPLAQQLFYLLDASMLVCLTDSTAYFALFRNIVALLQSRQNKRVKFCLVASEDVNRTPLQPLS